MTHSGRGIKGIFGEHQNVQMSSTREPGASVESYFSFFGFVLMSPSTVMSEKSILNLLSSAAILCVEEAREKLQDTWRGYILALDIERTIARLGVKQ